MERGDKRRTFVSIQLSAFDPRPFVNGSSRFADPAWPNVREGQDFVRGVGQVRARPLGSPIPVLGEAGFVNVGARLMRLEPATEAHRFVPVYSRLFGTEAGYRLDFGLRARVSAATSSVSIAAAALETGITTDRPNGSPVSTLQSVWTSGWLVERIQDATGPAKSVRGASRTLQPQQPLVLVERPGHSSEPELRVHPVIDGAHRRFVWSLEYSRDDRQAPRRARSALWRTHYELGVLRGLLRLAQVEWDHLRLDPFLRALRGTMLRLKRARGGSLESSLVGIAMGVRGFSGSEFDDAIESIRGEASGLARSLDIVLERAAFATLPAGSTLLVQGRGSKTVVDKSVRIGKNSSNNNIAVDSANAIQGSSVATLASPELRAELAALSAHRSIVEHPEGSELLAKLLSEVDGKRRLGKARKLWSALGSISPAISIALESASLAAQLLGAG